MSILNVEKLSHSFAGNKILDDVSFRILKGEHIGLVGTNGEGKSTFLKLITGKLDVEDGKVEWSKKVRIGYLDQHASVDQSLTIYEFLKTAFQDLLDKEIRLNQIYEEISDPNNDMDILLEEMGELQSELEIRNFYLIDSKIQEVASSLGILDFNIEKLLSECSGGQRTKVLLAKLLLEKPDILLLDEPTNYLDEEHISWLKNYLLNYENAFVLISHDIPFLNDVINIVYNVNNKKIERYVGNYDNFLAVYEMQKNQIEAAYKKQQQEIAELKDFVARNKARVATRNMASSRQKKLDSMELIELEAPKIKPVFNFLEDRVPSKLIFEAKDLVIGYEKPLSQKINLILERGKKIALIGANGIGKSTLLKSLIGIIPAISGKVELGENINIGYYEQEVKREDLTCIDYMWKYYPYFNQAQIRAALAQCGLISKHIESKVTTLSGGEEAKLRFCKLMNQKHNILILDEPTNHLDFLAKESLKDALIKFNGTILLVSHEPDFYKDIVDEIWDAREWSNL